MPNSNLGPLGRRKGGQEKRTFIRFRPKEGRAKRKGRERSRQSEHSSREKKKQRRFWKVAVSLG